MRVALPIDDNGVTIAGDPSDYFKAGYTEENGRNLEILVPALHHPSLP